MTTTPIPLPSNRLWLIGLVLLAATLPGAESSTFTEPAIEPIVMTAPLTPPPVTGRTVHVATTGDDATGDGSLELPWRSIQHGLDQLHPGERLYVRGGDYSEKNLTFARSGRPDAYITLAGYPGEEAHILGGGSLATFNMSIGDRWMPKREAEEAYLVVRDLHLDGQGNNNVFRIQGANRHHIWVVNNDIQGSMKQPVIQVFDGAYRVIVSANRIHDAGKAGVLFHSRAYGSIVEWNTVTGVGSNADDEGAIKLMAPNCFARYNTITDCYRSSDSTSPGWAPASQGGKQWSFLQGVTGLYLDYAAADAKHNPVSLDSEDGRPCQAYGNRVSGCNAGIYVWQSSGAQVFDNIAWNNGTNTAGGWREGNKTKGWMPFGGPAGHGLAIGYCQSVRMYRNISFGNVKSGLWLFKADEAEAWDNVFFANRASQLHLRDGVGMTLGFNRLLRTSPQPLAMRWQMGKVLDYPTIEAFRAAIPYIDASTVEMDVAGDLQKLALDGSLMRQPPTAPEVWKRAREELLVAARKAGAGGSTAKIPQAPYDPTKSLQQPLPWRVPGTVEFEDYDVGGPEVAYHDLDNTNQGAHYRTDKVGIKANAKASNGAAVGWTQNGEWLAYTVEIGTAGVYRVDIIAASPFDGALLQLSLDGQTLSKPVVLKVSGDWDSFVATTTDLTLAKTGTHILRATIVAGPVDLDALRFTLAQ